MTNAKPTPKPPADNPPVDNRPDDPTDVPPPDLNLTEDDDREEETHIVHRERIIQGDQIVDKVHGPMPVSQWSKYERKHNL